MRRLGPVLQFLGCQGDCWGVSALLVGDDGDAAPVFEFARAEEAIRLGAEAIERALPELTEAIAALG